MGGLGRSGWFPKLNLVWDLIDESCLPDLHTNSPLRKNSVSVTIKISINCFRRMYIVQCSACFITNLSRKLIQHIPGSLYSSSTGSLLKIQTKAGPLTKLNKSLSTDQTIHVNNMQLLCYENVSQKKQSKLFGPKTVLYIC